MPGDVVSMETLKEYGLSTWSNKTLPACVDEQQMFTTKVLAIIHF